MHRVGGAVGRTLCRPARDGGDDILRGAAAGGGWGKVLFQQNGDPRQPRGVRRNIDCERAQNSVRHVSARAQRKARMHRRRARWKVWRDTWEAARARWIVRLDAWFAARARWKVRPDAWIAPRARWKVRRDAWIARPARWKVGEDAWKVSRARWKVCVSIGLYGREAVTLRTASADKRNLELSGPSASHC